MAANFNDLPTEIIEKIIEQSVENLTTSGNDLATRRYNLFNLALVSKVFFLPVKKELWSFLPESLFLDEVFLNSVAEGYGKNMTIKSMSCRAMSPKDKGFQLKLDGMIKVMKGVAKVLAIAIEAREMRELPLFLNAESLKYLDTLTLDQCYPNNQEKSLPASIKHIQWISSPSIHATTFFNLLAISENSLFSLRIQEILDLPSLEEQEIYQASILHYFQSKPSTVQYLKYYFRQDTLIALLHGVTRSELSNSFIESLLPFLPSLTTLIIPGVLISAEATIPNFRKLSSNSTLTVLDLGDIKIDENTFNKLRTVLESLEKFKNLESLRIHIRLKTLDLYCDSMYYEGSVYDDDDGDDDDNNSLKSYNNARRIRIKENFEAAGLIKSKEIQVEENILERCRNFAEDRGIPLKFMIIRSWKQNK